MDPISYLGGTPSAPTPIITSLSDSSGSTAGGDTITLTGKYFVDGCTVTVGGVAATNVVFNSSTSVDCDVPAGTAGAKDVVLTNPDGLGSTSQPYTYITPPAVTSTSPSLGSEDGGTDITITGTGFVDGATVLIGGDDATDVVVVNATTITCTTPAGTVTGSATSVRVTNPSTLFDQENVFQYVPGPDLTSTRLLWYRSDVLTQSGGLVTAVPDLSGQADSGRNLSAAGANRPGYTASNANYNNLPSIDFGAASTKKLDSGTFDASVAQTFTVYIVGQTAHAVSPRFFAGVSNNVQMFDNLATGLIMNCGTNNLAGGYSAGARIIWARCEGASSQLGNNKISATASADAGANAIGTSITLGNVNAANLPLEGEICEFIVLEGHNTTDKSAILTYLQAKYAITMAA